MKHSWLVFSSTVSTTDRASSIARFGAAAALALLGLAITAGSLGLDRDGMVGTVTFPALGIATFLCAAIAFLAGGIAIFGEHDRSVGTILATVGGALLGWFMIVELSIHV